MYDQPFVLLSVAEMRKKYYWPDEEPPKVYLSPDKVPEMLRCLIPLAERWGISDDILRSDANRKASADEIEYLKAAVRRFDNELDDWLAGPEASSPNHTSEYLAFSNMRMAADGC
jgi:hypothetical protein